MRGGVDIDDVLVDALPHFLAAFNARFGKAVPLEQADWDIFRAFPEIPFPDRPAFWRSLEEERFLFQRPVHPEAAAGVRRLRALGHDLFLVTGRLPWHRAPTLAWLAAQGLGDVFADLIVKQPRLRREKHKRDAAAALRLDAFVEGERRTAESSPPSPSRSSSWTAPGTTAWRSPASRACGTGPTSNATSPAYRERCGSDGQRGTVADLCLA